MSPASSGAPTPPGTPRPLARDADRERLVGVLREHFALGDIDLDELNRRVGVVLAAHYTDDAVTALAGLPQLAAPPGGGRDPVRRPRKRGHAHAATPGAGWIPTDERFRDPTTRVVTRVWVDPADQSRHYIPEGDDEASAR
jgi:hypothetical protein